MNANRAEMEALIRAFSRMREKCELSIHLYGLRISFQRICRTGRCDALG